MQTGVPGPSRRSGRRSRASSPPHGGIVNKYVIITPARDEADTLEHTIEAILAQSVRPVQWILVNDGSRDGTAEIMDRYAREHSWITVLHRQDRGFRKAGGGVVDAFYDGYS